MSAATLVTTPEFLAWTLALPCALKEFDGWEQPERVERHLRSAREYGDALREGRCDGAVCYDRRAAPTSYFQVAETLRIYGGADRVVAACVGCPANAREQVQAGSLAGCYGELPLPQPVAEFYRRIELASEQPGRQGAWERLFPATAPRWFGWWLAPIRGEAAALLNELFADEALALNDPPWASFRRALLIAASGEISLQVTHYPRGLLAGRNWKLAPYCVHCHAELTDYRRPCPACDQFTRQMPSLLRHVRGSRPWRRLPADKSADNPRPSAPG
jgi:hypothetical protein